MRSLRGRAVAGAVGALSLCAGLGPVPVAATNMVYIAVTPCRVAQTTVAGGIITAGATRTFAVLGPTTNYAAQGGNAAGCGIPALGEVEAVFFNFVAQNPAGPGNFKAWAGDGAEPFASTINYQLLSPNLNVANGVAVPVRKTAPAGVDLNVKASISASHVVIDVVGYFAPLNQLQNVGANTALGTRALPSSSTGLGNTAVGAFALRSNTTGLVNTAIGLGALATNTTGARNTAGGSYALFSNTIGQYNTASGGYALFSSTTGNQNTANGVSALRSNTIGAYNTASGAYALSNNNTGFGNTASGRSALLGNTTGTRNTAGGNSALGGNSTGSRNIALGYWAGLNLTTGSYNVAIGNLGVAAEANTIRLGNSTDHTRTFIAGIRSQTTGVADAVAVLIDSAGQLGTVSSSRRFKEEIADMEESSERLFALRPVQFRYKPEVQAGERPLEYGLIAEEVAEVFPELVVYGKDGEPETVRYHVLVPLLLNELQKERAERAQEVLALRRETAMVLARLAALESGVQVKRRPPS